MHLSKISLVDLCESILIIHFFLIECIAMEENVDVGPILE